MEEASRCHRRPEPLALACQAHFDWRDSAGGGREAVAPASARSRQNGNPLPDAEPTTRTIVRSMSQRIPRFPALVCD